MEELFLLQFRGIPDYMFIISFFVLSILVVSVFFIKKDIRSLRRIVSSMLLAEYLFLMLCSTVICRTSRPEIVRLELLPFWNYGEILANRDPQDYWEILLNIALYIPIGFLCMSLYRQNRIRNTIVTCVLLSIFVEILQLVFHKGLCEIDDVMHNGIGGITGMALFLLIVRMFSKIKNRHALRYSSFLKG